MMRKLLTFLLMIFFPTLLVAQGKQTAQASSIAFTHVTVIDMTGAKPKREMTVIIEGNHISTIGRAGKVSIPRNALIVDAKGKFLIPGLWDMHVHVDDAGSWMFPLFLANGVTGLRDMGSHVKQIAVWREMRDKDALIPRILGAGSIVSGKIGDSDPRMVLVSTPDEAAKAVDDLATQKVDFIKVHDWITPDAYRGLVSAARKRRLPVVGHLPVLLTGAEISNAGQKSVEHYGNAWGGLFVDCSTLEDELRGKMQKLVSLTTPEFNPMKMFAAQGEDWELRLAVSFEPAKAKRLAKIFKHNQTWLVPTLQNAGYSELFITEAALSRDPRLKYFPIATQKMIEELVQANNAGRTNAAKLEGKRHLYQRQLELVRIMKAGGVRMLAGTDAIPFPPAFPGFDLHDEMQRFVDAGLTPLEALKTATVNPAKYFDMINSLGTIEEGKLADLVLLDANPLEDINNTKQITAVVFNGHYLSKDAREKMLADVKSMNNEK